MVDHRTHLGQSPNDHVVLELVGGFRDGYGPAKLDFVRVLPDASRVDTGTGGFRIPVHHFLVITDVDWQYAGGAPDSLQVLRLFIDKLSGPVPPGPPPPLVGGGERVFESAIVLNNNGVGGASVAMTTGFVVGEECRIGIDVVPGPQGPPGGLQHAILRGYLIKKKNR